MYGSLVQNMSTLMSVSMVTIGMVQKKCTLISAYMVRIGILDNNRCDVKQKYINVCIQGKNTMNRCYPKHK